MLGRALDCQVHIRDLTVSRRHARISRRESGYVIEDLGSGNGTFVNEEPVVHHNLAHGDSIRIASASFTFEEVVSNPTSVTMVGTLESEPQIVKVVDASRNIFNEAQALTSSGNPKAIQIMAARLRTVYAVSEAISSLLDLDELLDEILNRLFETFPRAERGFLMLKEADSDELTPRAV